MDYKERYENALEKARKYMAKGYDVLMPEIFPELTESEDERIRKDIMEAVENWHPYERVEDIRAYLEKQKMIAAIPDELVECYKNLCERGNRGVASLINAINGINEQNEQKPAEWSDTNELVFQDICKHLKEEGFGGWVVLLEALRNGEFQFKQEWSEEEKPIPQEEFDAAKHESLWGEQKPAGWKQGKRIEVGNKVKIHCREDRNKDMLSIYNDKVGEVISIWDAQRNPWGPIIVRLDNGCKNGFHEDELDIFDEPPTLEKHC